MNNAAAGTFGLVFLFVIAAFSIGSIICFIQVLIALFKKEGTGLGILGLFVGLYPFIWGWIKSTELGLKKIMIWWTVCLVALTGLWAVVLVGMVSFAGNPMFKRALDREIRAQQDSYDRLAMMKSMNNVKQLCLGCVSWADDHQGNFPAQLEDLFVDKYLGTGQSQLLSCPLLNDDSRLGYLYQGNGVSPTAPGSTVVIVSVWTDGHGKHIVGHKDGSVAMESVKQRKSNRKADTDAGVAKISTEPSNAAPTTSNVRTAVMPPAAPTITLIADEKDRLIHRVIFPSEQMPTHTDNYFWVVEFPDHDTKVKPLRPKAHFWMAPPKTSGTFKVRIEYRADDLKRPASNTVDLIVP